MLLAGPAGRPGLVARDTAGGRASVRCRRKMRTEGNLHPALSTDAVGGAGRATWTRGARYCWRACKRALQAEDAHRGQYAPGAVY